MNKFEATQSQVDDLAKICAKIAGEYAIPMFSILQSLKKIEVKDEVKPE